MNRLEVAQLLTYASMVDNRIVAPETVEAWFDVIGYLPYDIAKEAIIEHRKTSDEYLIPVHVTRFSDIALMMRESERVRAIETGHIPADFPKGKVIDPEIMKASEQWRWDRKAPTFYEIETFNAIGDAMTDEEHDAWVADGRPWRIASGKPAYPVSVCPEGVPTDFGAIA